MCKLIDEDVDIIEQLFSAFLSLAISIAAFEYPLGIAVASPFKPVPH